MLGFLLRRAPVAVLVATFAGGQKVCPQDLPRVMELAYDDGQPVDTLDLGNASLFGMRFSPPAFPVRLLALKYFLRDTTQGTSFRFFVHRDNAGEPADVIFGPLAGEGERRGWNTLDLRPFGLVVDFDFHFVLGLDGKSILYLGAENREPISGRASLGDCCGWWRGNVDLMIRAEVELVSTSVPSFPSEPRWGPVLSPFPNPTNGWVCLLGHLPAEGESEVEICAVDGRVLRRWALAVSGGSPFRLLWDGRDARGREVPSGIYLARLVLRGKVLACRKLTVLR